MWIVFNYTNAIMSLLTFLFSSKLFNNILRISYWRNSFTFKLDEYFMYYVPLNIFYIIYVKAIYHSKTNKLILIKI